MTKLTYKELVIAGGGYVGLTGAMHAASAGFKVWIYDPDAAVVNAINSGKPRAGEYLGYIDDNVVNLVKDGEIKATSDFNEIAGKEIHLLAVPTEKNGEPYFDIVRDSLISLHKHVPAGAVIMVESTLQPGTIDSILPYLDRQDVSLAVCPRLDWFADKSKNVTNLPRIVGGVNESATEYAAEILGTFCKDIRKTTYRVAELVKAGQNALYFAQIMAAHQIAEAYQSRVDMNEVLKLIGVHWRLPDLYLGAGTSGRCVAAGAKYIVAGSGKKDYKLAILEDAIRYDSNWREIIADKMTLSFDVIASLTAELLVMGIAYRANFSDFGNSAGLDIANHLADHCWNVSIHDPVIRAGTLFRASKLPIAELGSNFDSILLATAHDAYLHLPEEEHLWRCGQKVLDATGAWEQYREQFKKMGVEYTRVGEQGWLDGIA